MNSADRQNTVRHFGTVTAVENGYATVRFERSSACKHCGACLEAGEREMEIRVENSRHAEVGDLVEVAMEKRAVLTATVLCYVLPLLGLLAGVIVGSFFGEWYAFGLGLGICAGMLLLLIPIERRAKTRGQFQPRMTGRQGDPSAKE